MKIMTELNILNRNINSCLFLNKLNLNFLLILLSKKRPKSRCSCGCSCGEDVSLTEMCLNQTGLRQNHYEYIYVEKERERERIYIYIENNLH